jgi:hypothetical protein
MHHYSSRLSRAFGMLTDPPDDDNVERRSLNEESRREANDFRWIESERLGCDQGESALRRWVKCHWSGFLRARWIEHMLGVRFWVELDRNEFGLLSRTPGEVRPLLDLILDQLKCGAENLDIICWARRETTTDEQQTVHDLLGLINVNAHRLRCHFFDE